LKQEVQETKLTSLKVYIQMKDIELENLKLKMKVEHLNKINGLCQTENDCWNKIISHSSSIIQENYLLLRNSGDLDNAMKDKLTSLLKMMQGERNVKFVDENTTSDLFEFNIDWKTDENVKPSPISAKKRGISDDSTEVFDNDAKKLRKMSDDKFVRPKAVKAIKFPETQQTQSHDLNVTFDAVPTTSKVLSDKANKITPTSTISKCESQV
jgi:hypothetical protein